MNRRKIVVAALAVVVAAAGLGAAFLLGRKTAPVHDRGWAQGYSVGYDEGVSMGRALQVGDTLPSTTKDLGTKAFQAGYVAGLDDSWGSFDGGWNIGQPYVVVIGKGVAGAAYRIASRELLAPGTTYRLCPGGSSICHG